MRKTLKLAVKKGRRKVKKVKGSGLGNMMYSTEAEIALQEYKQYIEDSLRRIIDKKYKGSFRLVTREDIEYAFRKLVQDAKKHKWN